MRNIFDQYSQPENRLTHALVSGLANDIPLLRRFLTEIGGCKGRIPKTLWVEEQRLPGDPPLEEKEAERRGLPDAWIHDDDAWSLLVESKVASPVTRDQLERHLRTAKLRGFDEVTLLVLAVDAPRAKLPAGSHFASWSEVYGWLRRQRDSEWAVRIAEYMEIAELRMTEEEYLKEGTLTEFSGFPFGRDNQYNYPEAKRVLRLAMKELRKKKELSRTIDADLEGDGRPAITGRDLGNVWDFIPTKHAKGGKTFTKHPHFTLSLNRDRVLASVTFPSGMRSEFRRNLVSRGEEAFFELVLAVEKNLRKVLRGVPGAQPWFNAVQRHFLSQRSPATLDARLEFDLRTALPRGEQSAKSRVHPQSQWLTAAYDTLLHRRSNYQTAIGALFPYQDDSTIRTKAAIDLIADTWIACKPVLWAALGK